MEVQTHGDQVLGGVSEGRYGPWIPAALARTLGRTAVVPGVGGSTSTVQDASTSSSISSSTSSEHQNTGAAMGMPSPNGQTGSLELRQAEITGMCMSAFSAWGVAPEPGLGSEGSTDSTAGGIITGSIGSITDDLSTEKLVAAMRESEVDGTRITLAPMEIRTFEVTLRRP
jgi:hypothetical protein